MIANRPTKEQFEELLENPDGVETSHFFGSPIAFRETSTLRITVVTRGEP